MGKNWGGRGGRGGGGRGGGGSGLKGNGHGSILGTCDAGRERECSKELVNVFSQVMEWIDEKNGSSSDDEEDQTKTTPAGGEQKSFHASLAEEIAEMKQGAKKPSQGVQSVDIGVKGLVLVHVMTKKYCPVQLVRALFDRIRETKEAYTKHVVRLVPLQLISFPRAPDMEDCLAKMITRQFPAYAAHYPNIFHPDNFKKSLTVPKHERKREREKEKEDAAASTVDSPEPTDGDVADNDEEKKDEGANVVADVINAKRARSNPENEEEGKGETERKCSESSLTETTVVVTEEETTETEVVAATSDADNVAPVASAETSMTPAVAVVAHPAPNQPFQHSGPTAVYTIYFKARMCNTLSKKEVMDSCYRLMPKDGVTRSNYRDPRDAVIMEAVKNILGVSYFRDYVDYCDLNIRKFHDSLLLNMDSHNGNGNGNDSKSKILITNSTKTEEKSSSSAVAASTVDSSTAPAYETDSDTDEYTN